MCANTVSSERRKNTRKRPPTLIYVELSATNGGMVRDLSEDGFALRAMMPLTAGERTSFSFLLDESTRIEGEGEIIWVEDKGRLAGIRFTQIPSQARKQLQDWVDDLSDAPAAKESNEYSGAPVGQTFDQLREEIRSSPSRGNSPKTNKPMWPVSTPEATLPIIQTSSQTPLEAALTDAPSTTEEGSKVEEPRHPVEPIPFPGLPSFSPNQDSVEIAFEPDSSERESLENTFLSESPARRISLPSFPEPDVIARPRPASELPDISKILMQPSRKAANVAHPPVLEPLEAPIHSREAFEEKPRRGFTLSRAVTIMFVLACVVAASVYHQAVGQGLIWLGAQMGGTPVGRTDVAATNDEVSNAEADRAAPKTPETTTQAPNSAVPATAQADGNNATSHRSSTSPAAVPSITQNPPPPVAPLASVTPPATSDQAQETGLVEYSKALQLLHSPGGSADPSEAVRLLWVSVEKGNPSAELTLAELYWHGQGVARNCDQTRILLSAAARKGNIDAQKRLQQFQREGCE